MLKAITFTLVVSKIMSEFRVDYHWFFGALSQSLAALIGIVGMFIVYRLQIQQGNINDSLKNLQMYLSAKERNNPDDFLHLTARETFLKVDETIGQYRSLIQGEDRTIAGIERALREGKADKSTYSRERGNSLARKEGYERLIEGFEERKMRVRLRREYRGVIKRSAFATIFYLCLLFLINLTLLSLCDFFKSSVWWGKITVAVSLVSTVIALGFIVRCCWISLDMGEPRVDNF